MEFTGRPQPDDVEAIDSPFAGTMMESCTVTHAKSLSALFPNISAEAADLLRCADMCAGILQTRNTNMWKSWACYLACKSLFHVCPFCVCILSLATLVVACCCVHTAGSCWRSTPISDCRRRRHCGTRMCPNSTMQQTSQWLARCLCCPSATTPSTRLPSTGGYASSRVLDHARLS